MDIDHAHNSKASHGMKTVTIRGKRWRVIRSRVPPDRDGDCDHPASKQKTIRIRRGLKDWRYLEVLIHEMLHASFWDVSEEAVTETAADITSALKSLGVQVGSGN